MQTTSPAWDNSTEYSSLTSPELNADMEEAGRLLLAIEKECAFLEELLPEIDGISGQRASDAAAAARGASGLRQRAYELLHNVYVFASCEASVDARNAGAKRVIALVQRQFARFEQAQKALELFLSRAPDPLVAAYLADPSTAPEAFGVKRLRMLRDQLLSLPEENLIAALEVDGHTAWGNLYSNLSGSLVCTVAVPGQEPRQTGVASAWGMLQNADPAVREAAFQGMNRAWESVEETCAAALNSLSGWRLETYRKRSSKGTVHFLDSPLHDNRIERATLEAMLDSVAEELEIGRRALRVRSRILGKKALAPWDLLAPLPKTGSAGSSPRSFEEGLALVERSFASVSPEMGRFARMMQERRWIEGRVQDTKRPGAYCTKFYKSRSPRVYMTYMGGARDISTLAHELGHAFHNWVMRDMHLQEAQYPMTLAETASIFAETVVAEALESSAERGELLEIAWGDGESAAAFLLNIPARFDLEKELYERRSERTFSAAELKALTEQSLRKWYGDTLTEVDSMHWASKLHYYITGLSFYNFPYTFGYLFSLGVYAQRERLGVKFYDAYVRLLRDTGRMTAEELAARHLGADLTKKDFWRASLSIVRKKIERLEALASSG